MWLACRGSGHFSRGSRPVAGKLWQWFNVTSCAGRGRSLQAAAGLEPSAEFALHLYPDELSLGDPALLHSRFRTALIRRRDTRIEYANSQTGIRAIDGQHALISAEPIGFIGAAASSPLAGSDTAVCIVLGPDLRGAVYYALSIPDTERLSRALLEVLAATPQ